MNNIFKISLLSFLLIIILLLAYTAFRANQNMLKVCPTDAITLKNGIAVIDSLRCIGCGRCALGIPSPYNLTLFPAIKPKAISESISDSVLTATPDPAKRSVLPAKIEQKVPERVNKTVSTPDKLTTKVKKLLYIVDPDACIGCTLCVKACPVNAITMVNGKAVIDTEKCIADGICINGNGDDFAGCPVSAISTKEAK